MLLKSKSMKTTTKFFLIPLFILFLGCKKITYNVGEQFTLRFSKSAVVIGENKQFEIKFIDLIEESRCPPDVQCFWQGQVGVKIKINDVTELIVGDSEKYPASIQFEGYSFKLLEVNYDQKKNFGKDEHCIITLQIN